MADTLRDLMAEARIGLVEVDPVELRMRLDLSSPPVVVDVREPAEWDRAHLPDALNIPRGVLELQADPASPSANPALCERTGHPVVLYCTQAPGARSALAAQTLRRMGYEQVSVLRGGLNAWSEAGLVVQRGVTEEV
jgi:rhodanese-related sulfurtransferase